MDERIPLTVKDIESSRGRTKGVRGAAVALLLVVGGLAAVSLSRNGRDTSAGGASSLTASAAAPAGPMEQQRPPSEQQQLPGSLAIQRASRSTPVYGDMTNAQLEEIWEDFLQDNNRGYADDSGEKAQRFQMFKQNLFFIDKLNAAYPDATFGITDRTDMSDAEKRRTRGLGPVEDSKLGGKTRYQALKDMYTDQDAIVLGEKGLDAVFDALSSKNMSFGMVPWVSASDCAACKRFEHFSLYTWDNLPENFDWRELGAVTDVKNQKYCGSCWTFSTAADLEGTHFLATGELESLSEQQLVACNTADWGCDGGYPYRAMQYIHKFGGLVTDDAYGYKGICAWGDCGTPVAGTPTCHTEILNAELESKRVASIGGYQLVSLGAEYEALLRLALVKNGPISIAFNANGMDYYLHGVVGCSAENYCDAGAIDHHTPCDPSYLDHAVLIVGYGVEAGVPYWVIKNSWGDAWGEDGYYRIVRGSNHCGVANFAVHSVVKSNSD